MTTTEIKQSLIDAINQTEDPVILLAIGRLINIDLDDSVVKLTDEQIEAIKLSIAQIEKGEYLTHEEAKKQAEGWLKD